MLKLQAYEYSWCNCHKDGVSFNFMILNLDFVSSFELLALDLILKGDIWKIY